ncbi:hypothetical protein KAT63_04715, partial [Candidatus Parcubacteria bacterium]|nr:hypothetical protein [Candidatus Parcubacteria bacterium]
MIKIITRQNKNTPRNWGVFLFSFYSACGSYRRVLLNWLRSPERNFLLSLISFIGIEVIYYLSQQALAERPEPAIKQYNVFNVFYFTKNLFCVTIIVIKIKIKMINEIIYKVFFRDCKENNLELWQCPGFLFVMMGFINIASMLGAYIIVKEYDMPELVVFSVSAVSIIIFSIGSSTINGFQQIAKANRMKSEFVSIVS